jgi:hypothetical protein
LVKKIRFKRVTKAKRTQINRIQKTEIVERSKRKIIIIKNELYMRKITLKRKFKNIIKIEDPKNRERQEINLENYKPKQEKENEESK